MRKTPYKVYEAFVRKLGHNPGSWSPWDYLGEAVLPKERL